MKMLDLCSGFGGASAAMKERGWTVYRIDIEPRVRPDVVADAGHLPLLPFQLDLLWASPTCTEYSRHDQPGLFPDRKLPDLTLWHTIELVIAEWQPRFWIIENVRGAIPFHGRPPYHVGSRYLWTNLPLFPSRIIFHDRHKAHLCSGKDPLRSAKRGYIPYPISEAVAITVESLLS